MPNLKYTRAISNFTDNTLTGLSMEDIEVPLDVFMGYVELLQCNGYKGSWKGNSFTLIGYNKGRIERTEIVLAF